MQRSEQISQLASSLKERAELEPDVDFGQKCAPELKRFHLTDPKERGIFSTLPRPPEFNLPKGMVKGSEDHLTYITLTASLEYIRDSTTLWKQSRMLWSDVTTHWIFDTKRVKEKGEKEVIFLFMKKGDQRPNKDANFWTRVSSSLAEDGGVGQVVKKCDSDALKLLDYLSKNRKRYPCLSGPKIGPLWVRMINDNTEIKLKNKEELPIPVDIHVARGSSKILFNGALDAELSPHKRGISPSVRKSVQEGWRATLHGSDTHPAELDEPLWTLGKYKKLPEFLELVRRN